MAESIGDRVIAIIAEQAMLDPAAVRADCALADLGIDSLGLVEAIFAIEEAFGISVPFNANSPGDPGLDVSTVGSVIEAVERLVAQRPE